MAVTDCGTQNEQTMNGKQTQVDVDVRLHYQGDICEQMSEVLWPAVVELGAEGSRSGMKLADGVRVTGELTLEIEASEK